MKTDRFEATARQLLSAAGITVNGGSPWDIQVHNQKFYQAVLSQANLGLGESYMGGWWDCTALDEFFSKIIRAQIQDGTKKNPGLVYQVLLARLLNRQSRNRAFQIGEKHYDLGNDLFINMLDKRLVYSCAYWQNAPTLDAAAGYRLRLGQFRQIRGGKIRGKSSRYHGIERTGGAG